VVVTLGSLDREALINILTEPKNALVKQYQRLFELDNVKLEFTREALEAIADEAMTRKTGARGLRAIIEEIMVDVMYDLPSREDVEKCIINRETVLKQAPPELVICEGVRKPLRKPPKKTGKLKKGTESAS